MPLRGPWSSSAHVDAGQIVKKRSVEKADTLWGDEYISLF